MSQLFRRGNRSVRSRTVLSIFALAVIVLGCAVRPPANVNGRSLIFKQFADRVRDYVRLHHDLESKLPPLSAGLDAPAIAAHQAALAESIRRSRTRAAHGDLFFPAVEKEIRHILRLQLDGTHGREIAALLRDDNPQRTGDVLKRRIAVNAPYPQGVAVSTMPPSLLLEMPRLPEELEYRFIGRHLILRDVTADIIVDYIWEAVAHL